MSKDNQTGSDRVDVRHLAEEAGKSPQATQGGSYGGVNVQDTAADAGQPQAGSTGQSVDQHASMSEAGSSGVPSGASRQGTMGSRSEQANPGHPASDEGGH